MIKLQLFSYFFKNNLARNVMYSEKEAHYAVYIWNSQ